MTKHKGRWKKEQDEALWAGVKKYGTGKWKVTLTDPQFGPALSNRSNNDLKDKWHNMTVGGTGSSSKHRAKTPMLEGVAANLPVNSPEPSSAVLLLEYGDTAKPSSSLMDRKSTPDKGLMYRKIPKDLWLQSSEDSC